MVVEGEIKDGTDVSETQDGSIMKIIKKEGYGSDKPTEGALVYVHYVGKLLDGTEFDSSRDKGKPIDFVLGRATVISGLEMGVETMKKGEIATFTIKPEYAYGKPGRAPTIPSNATLVFEVELLYWDDEEVTLDSLVSKRILKKGKGSCRIGDITGGTLVSVHLIGRDGDRVFDERDVQFVVGEGDSCDVIPGVDEALKKMKKDEIAEVTADASYAFGKKGKPEWGIAPGAQVKYEVHLKCYDQSKAPWELSSEERIENAKLAKVSGTEYFKQEKYSLALSKFCRLVSLLEGLPIDEDVRHLSPMILAGHLNVALCYLKLGKYKDCINSCDKALYRDEENVKGLYRKARALLALHYLDESKKLFDKVLELDPKNKEARTYHSIAKKKLDEYRKKEKKVYANMFDKFAARDAKKNSGSESEEQKGGKDVFTRAEEDAKNIVWDEPGTSAADDTPKKDRAQKRYVDENPSVKVENLDIKVGKVYKETSHNQENTPIPSEINRTVKDADSEVSKRPENEDCSTSDETTTTLEQQPEGKDS